MNIDELNGKMLDDEMIAKLKERMEALEAQRDAARNESINQRRGLKEKVATLEAAVTRTLEKLGIESIDEIDNLPDAKGAADAVKQAEAKIKRLEKANADLVGERDAAVMKQRSAREQALLTQALAKHDFTAPHIISDHISKGLVWEGDELFAKSSSGTLMSIDDAVAGLAKAEPDLLKSKGAGGAGVRPGNAGGGGKIISEAEFNALSPKAQAEKMAAGFSLSET